MNDFNVSLLFVRPDGRKELKDPNWLEDTGFECLAPGVFGSVVAWSSMTDRERVECSEDAVLKFSQRNGTPYEIWYEDYLTRIRRRRKA